MKRDTAEFIRLLEEQNRKVVPPKVDPGVGLDPVREQRERERREKFGKQRATQVHTKHARRVDPFAN